MEVLILNGTSLNSQDSIMAVYGDGRDWRFKVSLFQAVKQVMVFIGLI